MKPVRFSMFPATASDNNVALSQTPAGAGNFTLNGATAGGSPVVATLDMPRRVALTFVGNETGHTFTLYGYDSVVGGNTISESIAGTGAGIVVSTLDYGRITRVAISAAATGAVKVGTVATGGVASSAWQLVDPYLAPQAVSINVDVSGTINYSIQYTYGDIMGTWSNGNWTPATLPPIQVLDDAIQASVTADGETTFNNPISAWRVLINSLTVPGGLYVTGIQAGAGGIAA